MQLTSSEAEQILRNAKKTAGYYKISQDLKDELTSEICLRVLEAKKCGQTLNQMGIDYLRKSYGRTGSHKNNALTAEQVPAEKILEGVNPERDPFLADQIGEALKHITREQRACLILTTMYGMNYNEIGLIFGFNQSRVSQLLKEAKALLVSKVKI